MMNQNPFQSNPPTNFNSQRLSKLKLVEDRLTQTQFVIRNQEKTSHQNQQKIKEIGDKQTSSEQAYQLLQNKILYLQEQISSMNSQFKKVIEIMANEIKMQKIQIDNLTNCNKLLMHSVNYFHQLSQSKGRKTKKYHFKIDKYQQQQEETDQQYQERDIQFQEIKFDKSLQSSPKSFSFVENALTKKKDEEKNMTVLMEKCEDYFISYEQGQNKEKSLNVVIENHFGKISFLEPLSLKKKIIAKSLSISQQNIEIFEEEWKDKNYKGELFNYKNYLNENEEERQKIRKDSIEKLLETTVMKYDRIDRTTGNLHFEMTFH